MVCFVPITAATSSPATVSGRLPAIWTSLSREVSIWSRSVSRTIQ